MADPIKRIEKTHIDEVTRTATSFVQWLLEQRHKAGSHTITHNNELQVFIGGQESFADIAKEIRKAKASIDIICWGFDPGMELERVEGKTWPRGDCYGDLLIAAGKRAAGKSGVQIRLLVWYDAAAVGPLNPRNMPGYTHGTRPWRINFGSDYAKELNADNSKSILEAHYKSFKSQQPCDEWGAPIAKEQIPMKAREEYCNSWYKAAMNHQLDGIEIRTRKASTKDVQASHAEQAKNQPRGVRAKWFEKAGMVYGGTHHQKPILIDYAYDEGRKAIGYVMGLNSLTDYWDTAAHHLEDGMREQGAMTEARECVQGKEADPGFRTLKPYRDYACRIDGGGALIALYNNFVKAWDRVSDGESQPAFVKCTGLLECSDPPAAMLRKVARHRHSSAQIVRTQPEDQDTSIKEIYFHATDLAANALGYLYVENQYFQCEEWAQRLLAVRRQAVKKWSAGGVQSGKNLREMPVMHVFVVIPVPERVEMIPRTYDTLATLGQQESMTGQSAMIKNTNDSLVGEPFDESRQLPPEVVAHANGINKPDLKTLEDEFGLKISTAMLNTCGFEGGRWRYREIYIHSKLLMVDDTFFTLGSANLNQRSMAVDSEINLATDHYLLTRALRLRIWNQLSGGIATGGAGTKQEIVDVYGKWTKLMAVNKRKKFEKSEIEQLKKISGFLLPLEDGRSSTSRLG